MKQNVNYISYNVSSTGTVVHSDLWEVVAAPSGIETPFRE